MKAAQSAPHGEVTATPGWPPVAIPGRPGWWRHLINGQQVDLPAALPLDPGPGADQPTACTSEGTRS